MPLFCTASPLRVRILKWQEVLRLDELRQDVVAVVGGVGRVVGHRAVVIDEADKTGVLDAVGLVGRDRKDDALADGELFGETQLVVRVRQPLDAIERALELVRGDAGLVPDSRDTLDSVRCG